MKKIFVVLVVLVLLSALLVFPVSASLNWVDITDRSLFDESGDAYYNARVYSLDADLKQNLYTEPYTVYIRLYLGVDSSFPLLDEYEELPLQSINDTQFADKKFRDVTTLISFGTGKSIKPTNVYIGEVAGSGYLLDLVPKEDSSSQSWYNNYNSYQGNYDVVRNSYARRVEFVLKYTVEPSTVINTTGSQMSFYDPYNYMDFTPILSMHAPYIGVVSVSVRDIYCIMDSSIVAQYNDTDMGTYHVIHSTNIFTGYDLVTDLYMFFKNGVAYKYGHGSSYVLETTIASTHNETTRFNAYAEYTNNVPYANIDNNANYGRYIDTQCHYVNDDTYFYGLRINANGLRYGEVRDPLNNTNPPSSTYYCGYTYQCNMNTYCSGLKFSVTLFLSYKENAPTLVQGENSINGDIDVSQFYKPIAPKFSTKDGLLEGLSDFFVSLFTETLPNIINNFIVWFMCESPLISTITKPIFLLAHLTVGYTISWIIPVLTSLGIYGGILFVIFLCKRLIPHLIGGE